MSETGVYRDGDTKRLHFDCGCKIDFTPGFVPSVRVCEYHSAELSKI